MGVRKTVATMELDSEESFELAGCLSLEITQLTALREMGKLPETAAPVLETLMRIRGKLSSAAGLTRNAAEERRAIEHAKAMFTRKPGAGNSWRE